MNQNRIEKGVILSLLLMPLLLLPLIAHWGANDNHKNYANHNYGKNLLNTLEPNSIFMTEGGDNQVFTSAYNQMAEFLRPDVRIYDQKGNVFYRIYGDFRYMSMNEVTLKRDIVDFEIYSRGRPVYLTWIRKPDVAVCGDWFVKRYGILFKVLPLRYRFLIDLGAAVEMDLNQALSLFRQYYANPAVLKKIKHNLDEMNRWYGNYLMKGRVKETLDRSRAHFINKEEETRIKRAYREYKAFATKALARRVDRAFMMGKLSALKSEGLIRLAGNRVRFVKDLDPPMKGDYWKKYRMDFLKESNAARWDYLTREILANYFFNQLQGLMEKVKYHLKRQDYFKRAGDAASLATTKKILADLRKREQFCIEKAGYYGHDNAAIHNNLAVIFVNRKKWSRARDAFRRAVEADPYMFMSTIYYLNLNLRLASESMDPLTESAALDEAERMCARAVSLIKGLGESSVPDYSLRAIGGADRARQYFARGERVYVRERVGNKAETRRIDVDEIMRHRQFYIRVPGYTLNGDYQRIKRFQTTILAPRKRIPFKRIVEARKRLDDKKGDFNLHLAYFSLLIQRNNMSLAVDAFRAMPEQKWARYEVFYRYGFFLENMGRINEAIAAYREFLRRDPDFYIASFRLALQLQRQAAGKERALQHFIRAYRAQRDEMKKKYPLFDSNYGIFHKAAWEQSVLLSGQLGKDRVLIDLYESADASLKKSVAGKKQAQVYGKALESVGRYKDAAAVYEASLKVNGLGYLESYALGRLFEERLNDTTRAKQEYSRLINMQKYIRQYVKGDALQEYYQLRNDAYRRLRQLQGISGR